jgi:GntR family transcriptional regulator
MSPLPDPELVLDGNGPIHSQIERQLRWLIQIGALAPGEELPSVRGMAVELAINPAAVEEAYGNLEREGYLTRAEGTGVLVAAPPQSSAGLVELCQEFLRQAACSGYSISEVLRVLHAQIETRVP